MARLGAGGIAITGGQGETTLFVDFCDLFDARTQRIEALPSLPVPRYEHACVSLLEGQVLLAGGFTATETDQRALDDVLVMDPETQRWEARGVLPEAIQAPVACPLPDGGALLCGGAGDDGALTLAMVFHSSGLRAVGPMAQRRSGHSAVPLPDGTILVLGGRCHDAFPAALTEEGVNEPVGITEIFDPETETFREGPPLPSPREEEVRAFALRDGSVVVVGGQQLGARGRPLEPILLRPGADAWEALPEPDVHSEFAVAAASPDGGFVVVGSVSEDIEPSGDDDRSPEGDWGDKEHFWCRRWNPVEGIWMTEPPPRVSPAGADLLSLPDGALYLVGRLEEADGGGLLAVERWSPDPVE